MGRLYRCHGFPLLRDLLYGLMGSLWDQQVPLDMSHTENRQW